PTAGSIGGRAWLDVAVGHAGKPLGQAVEIADEFPYALERCCDQTALADFHHVGSSSSSGFPKVAKNCSRGCRFGDVRFLKRTFDLEHSRKWYYHRPPRKLSEWRPGDTSMYDAIIVGARCAGSPVALLLARKGYKVLLVDRMSFPSDMAFSNHFVHQAGAAALKRWGLLERLAATGCPPITHDYWDYGAFSLSGPVPAADGVNTAFAPRRIMLDPLLVSAAVESGAELRDGFSAQELLWENGRVTGIRGRCKGAVVSEKARIVIGADGMFSMVAKAVKPPET